MCSPSIQKQLFHKTKLKRYKLLRARTQVKKTQKWKAAFARFSHVRKGLDQFEHYI